MLRDNERKAAMSSDVDYTPFDKGIPKKEKYGRKEVMLTAKDAL